MCQSKFGNLDGLEDALGVLLQYVHHLQLSTLWSL